MGIRDRKIIQDTRGQKTAQFISGASNLFAKGQQAAAARREKEQKELATIRRQASTATKDYAKRKAEYKKTGIKSLDEQIIAELDKKARNAANLYMKAFGPDGDEDAMFEYQETIAQDAADLNDLTVFVGTLDADLDRRDDADTKGLLRGGTEEDGTPAVVKDLELFKNGITNGDSEIELKHTPGVGYELIGVNTSASGNANMQPQTISLTEYHDNIKKNGSNYMVVNEDLQEEMDIYGGDILSKDFISTMEVDFTGEKTMSKEAFEKEEKKLKDLLANTTDAAEKKKINTQLEDLKEENKRKKSYTAVNRQNAYDSVLNKLNQDSKGGFKSYQKDGVVPREQDAWEFLKDKGYLQNIDVNYPDSSGLATVMVDKNVSWDKYNNPNKQSVLNEAMSRYLVDNQMFQGVEGDVLETDVKYQSGTPQTAATYNTTK